MAAAIASAGQPQAGPGSWISAAVGLVVFGAACGVALAVGGLQAFYIALSLVIGIAVLFDFRLGAFLLVLIVPLGATELFPHNLFGVTGLNPLNLLLGITLLSALLRGRLAGITPRPLVWLFLAPILVAGLLGMRHVDEIVPYFFDYSLINYTDALGYLREAVLRPLLLVLMALVVAAAAAHVKKPEQLLGALMASLWSIALIEIVFIAASGVRLGTLASPRARTFFNDLGLHANDLGRLFAVGYAILLFVWWEARRPALKAALFATLAIASLALVLSFSRSAYLAFMLVSALFVLWKFNARTVSLAIGTLAVVMAFAPHSVWSRITYGFGSDANTISADRIDGIWTPLLPEIGKSPFWGSGIDSILWSEPMRAGTMLMVGHPHNAYLQAMLDMGLIGTVLLLAYYVHVWRGFRGLGGNAYLSPEMRGFFQGATAALLCFFVTGMSGSSLRPDVDFAYLWVAIGMMYGVLARRPAG